MTRQESRLQLQVRALKRRVKTLEEKILGLNSRLEDEELSLRAQADHGEWDQERKTWAGGMADKAHADARLVLELLDDEREDRGTMR